MESKFLKKEKKTKGNTFSEIAKIHLDKPGTCLGCHVYFDNHIGIFE